MAKILVLDIETSPALAYIWRTFKENISNEQIVDPTRMISFSAKWVGEKKVRTYTEWDDGAFGMVLELWDLLNEADAIVSYNGKSFDIPHINREFIFWRLDPPAPYAHIDLYQTVRSKFKFMSGKLGWVVDVLDLGGKMAHEGFGLWRSVLEGDPKAQKRMAKYNAQDVVITEALYLELRPWIGAHPSVALIDGHAHACPACGSTRLQKRGVQRTSVSEFQRYQCNECHSWSRTGRAVSKTALRPVSA